MCNLLQFIAYVSLEIFKKKVTPTSKVTVT